MGHPIDVASASLTVPGGSFLTFAEPGGVSFDVTRGVWRGGNDPPMVDTVVKVDSEQV